MPAWAFFFMHNPMQWKYAAEAAHGARALLDCQNTHILKCQN